MAPTVKAENKNKRKSNKLSNNKKNNEKESNAEKNKQSLSTIKKKKHTTVIPTINKHLKTGIFNETLAAISTSNTTTITAAKNINNKLLKIKGEKVYLKYSIDCTIPAKDNAVNTKDLVKFLTKTIKIDGDKNKLKVSSSSNNVVVECFTKFKKRSLKYLTRKFLKKQILLDYIRIVESGKDSYQLVYNQKEDAIQ